MSLEESESDFLSDRAIGKDPRSDRILMDQLTDAGLSAIKGMAAVNGEILSGLKFRHQAEKVAAQAFIDVHCVARARRHALSIMRRQVVSGDLVFSSRQVLKRRSETVQDGPQAEKGGASRQPEKAGCESTKKLSRQMGLMKSWRC